MASMDLIKKLRDMTQAGVMDAVKALKECGDDLDKAAAWLREKGIEIFYNLQNQILNYKCNELMSYKDFIKMIIGDKSPETIKKLDKLPDGENICHGDFHLWNILIDDSGKAKVIDFMNVCCGPKLYDIARTFYLLKGDGSSDEGKSEEEMAIIRQREKLLDKYLVLHGVKKEELQPYLEVIEVCHKCEML